MDPPGARSDRRRAPPRGSPTSTAASAGVDDHDHKGAHDHTSSLRGRWRATTCGGSRARRGDSAARASHRSSRGSDVDLAVPVDEHLQGDELDHGDDPVHDDMDLENE